VPPPRPVRIITVDDHARFLSLAREVIDATPGFEAVGEAAGGLDGVIMADALRPDIVLMDVRMPGMSGIQAGRRILDAGTTRLLVFLSCDLVEVPEDLAGVPGIVVLRKEQLRPAILRRVWEGAEPRGSLTAERAV